MPDGVSMYTDRKCADVGGVERLARDTHAIAGSRRIYRGGCARNVEDLVFEVTSAIDTGDVNQLASVYHWAGMSGRGSIGVMRRLEAVVQRPLIDIRQVTPRGPDGEDGDLYPQTTVRSAPTALRVEQTLRSSATPSRTVFGIHRYFGCWWLTG